MPAHLLEPPSSSDEPTIHEANKQAWDELVVIRKENAKLIKQLRSFAIGMDPLSATQMRLTAFIETVFPSATVDGQAAQIQLEYNFESMLAGTLAEVRRQAVTAQLQAGAHVPPEMLEHMARAEKAFRG